MFTGIVAACGQISDVTALGDAKDHGVRVTIDAADLDLDDVSIGDSIAIQGACMTVAQLDKTPGQQRFSCDVSRESLNKTVGLDKPGLVNLEKAMRLSDRIGGHLVSGHVDGIGTVKRFSSHGESWTLDIFAPRELSRFLAYKGSVTVNGVSLTVNSVSDDDQGSLISINLIPHTVQVTSLRELTQDDPVNLEIDLVARYVERMNSLQPE